MKRLWAARRRSARRSRRPRPAGDRALRRAARTGGVKASGSSPPTRSCRMPDSRTRQRRWPAPSWSSCQDAYHPTETSALAHAVLPAAAWPEKQGTMTNSERRVGLLRRAIEAPGEALPDWRIFARLGRRARLRRALRLAARRPRSTTSSPPAPPAACATMAGLSHEPPACARAACSGRAAPSPSARASAGAVRPPLVTWASHTAVRSPVRRPPLPHADGRALGRPSTHADPRRRRARLPSAAHHRPHRRAMAHADAHRTSRDALVAAERRAVHGAASRGRPGRRRRGRQRARVRLAPRLGQPACAASTTLAGAGNRVCAVSLGCAARPTGAGAVNNRTHRATDPVSHQPELKAAAMRIEPVSAARSATGSAPAPIHRPEAERAPAARRLVIIGAGPAGVATARASSPNPHRAPGRSRWWGASPACPTTASRSVTTSRATGRRRRWRPRRRLVSRARRDAAQRRRGGVGGHHRPHRQHTLGLRLPTTRSCCHGSKPLMPPIEAWTRRRVRLSHRADARRSWSMPARSAASRSSAAAARPRARAAGLQGSR